MRSAQCATTYGRAKPIRTSDVSRRARVVDHRFGGVRIPLRVSTLPEEGECVPESRENPAGDMRIGPMGWHAPPTPSLSCCPRLCSDRHHCGSGRHAGAIHSTPRKTRTRGFDPSDNHRNSFRGTSSHGKPGNVERPDPELFVPVGALQFEWRGLLGNRGSNPADSAPRCQRRRSDIACVRQRK